MATPLVDPREHFLVKLRFRIDQATTEYSALVETFDKRMDEYIFIDSISGIVDAWETFKRNDILLFTKCTSSSQTWPRHIDTINRNIKSLDRQCKLLIAKRERFKFKLESFHTISSLSQAHAAVAQGDDLRMLTKVTVQLTSHSPLKYMAFPLLFTIAFFGIDFISPKHPWPIFVSMLLLTALVNYMVASQRSPKRVWKELKEWRLRTRKQSTV
ncbi:hypothetical protein TW65_01364 [Stemphylium lycopersici]|uniref:Uncharacterized protein n=1 Tax=Stemphylium lycopersici TaxID=183478 RepID=A0A364MV32_STELY|nr:hypothetical protein TW65_01364 [Stemphylium lycopersici]RAR04588.1 hypothetical protein DDE83_007779 [Stemphylium lycopersici]